MTRTLLAAITSLGLGLATAFSASALSSAEYPPSANVGQCFARVLTPDVIETVSERVEATAASTTQRVIPAAYETQTFRVKIKEETTAYRTIPAVYETVTEQVMVEPERQILVAVPAKYESWTETVEVEPARMVWKAGDGLYGRGMAGTGTAAPASGEVATGEVLCRVMQPAKVRTVRRTRQTEPARTEARTIPAKYKTVSRQVVKTAPRVETFTVDAEYADIPVQVMVSPEQIEQQVVPATYRTVERKVVRSKGGLQWAEVLCDTNSTASKVAEIQRALVGAGYTVAVDGAYGPQTQRAMESFQRANGLSVGYMTVETVQALNVNPYT